MNRRDLRLIGGKKSDILLFSQPPNKISRPLRNVLIYISYISNKRIFVPRTFVF